MEFDNFIGIFPNAFSKEYCESVIQHYHFLSYRDRVWSRQQSDGVAKVFKDSDQIFLTEELDPELIETGAPIMRNFSSEVNKYFGKYAEQYGQLTNVARLGLSYCLKIQKTVPTGGYHVWHCETETRDSGTKLLAVQLYLNDVEEGGETEFLYQSKRVKPKQGTLLIWPSGFTHAHRGNPPLSGVKYTINTWIEFKE